MKVKNKNCIKCILNPLMAVILSNFLANKYAILLKKLTIFKWKNKFFCVLIHAFEDLIFSFTVTERSNKFHMNS